MLDQRYIEEKMCPIGLASFLLGDKWIPLIIRDIALFDRRTFNHMLNSNMERISSGSLSSRLKQMLHLNLLHVEKSDEHVQKKLYYLTEAGISFVPILWNLAAWTQEFRNPSQALSHETVNRYSSDKATMEAFIDILRKIHIEKTIQPDPNWWV
jgi:DNA-binding HxlR family transcriptional regulator